MDFVHRLVFQKERTQLFGSCLCSPSSGKKVGTFLPEGWGADTVHETCSPSFLKYHTKD